MGRGLVTREDVDEELGGEVGRDDEREGQERATEKGRCTVMGRCVGKVLRWQGQSDGGEEITFELELAREDVARIAPQTTSECDTCTLCYGKAFASSAQRTATRTASNHDATKIPQLIDPYVVISRGSIRFDLHLCHGDPVSTIQFLSYLRRRNMYPILP